MRRDDEYRACSLEAHAALDADYGVADGKETLHSEQTLPDSAYPSQVAESGEEKLTLTFEKGEIKALFPWRI